MNVMNESTGGRKVAAGKMEATKLAFFAENQLMVVMRNRCIAVSSYNK